MLSLTCFGIAMSKNALKNNWLHINDYKLSKECTIKNYNYDDATVEHGSALIMWDIEPRETQKMTSTWKTHTLLENI